MFPKAISHYSRLFLVVLVLAVTVLTTTAESEPTYHNHSNAFGFIQSLQGCHKGQNASGLHRLKHYLEKFGYLDYTGSSNVHAADDEFDDVLESAVKSYQRNYHLGVTGTVDDATAKQMAMPRCGIPDKVSKKKNHRNRKLIHGVSHYSFFDGAPRWPASKSRLTYRFTSGDAPITDGVRSACARAFSRWEQVSHFTFQEVPGGSESDIVIGFHSRDHGDGNPFDGWGGTLAHAFAPTVGLFHYDAEENWAVNPGRDELDLESVAVHEIGHLLGLGHEPNVPEAIMYPSFGYGRVKRDLHADDIRGIRALYGLRA